MSDDEDILHIKKQKIIHYGSLEEQERALLSTVAVKSGDSDEEGSSSNMGQQIAESGNINISDGEYEGCL
jgi:U4/U6 small nuclear ribonucleoprotein PRP4